MTAAESQANDVRVARFFAENGNDAFDKLLRKNETACRGRDVALLKNGRLKRSFLPNEPI
jgi:hypothetical protein